MTVEIVTDTSQEKAILETCIKSKAKQGESLQILEAGCGNKWQLSLTGIDYTLSGIDIDADAVALRQQKYNDLDDVLIGDLRTAELPENQYDVIYTAYVLEHVDNVSQVLKNFYRWLKPGGVIIIKVPDRDSVYGFMARNTPHWTHVLYYRWIKGNKNAGKPGYLPYPTVYDKALARSSIAGYCSRLGLKVRATYGKNNYLRKKSLRDHIIRIFVQMVNLFSFGKLAWHYNDLIYIIEKPASRPAHADSADKQSHWQSSVPMEKTRHSAV